MKIDFIDKALHGLNLEFCWRCKNPGEFPGYFTCANCRESEEDELRNESYYRWLNYIDGYLMPKNLPTMSWTDISTDISEKRELSVSGCWLEQETERLTREYEEELYGK